MTTLETVRTFANDHLIWLIATPLVAVWCFLLDGVFVGATQTKAMRNGMLITLPTYLLAWYVLQPMGNDGLWLALLVFFAVRGITLAALYPALVRAKTKAD